MHIIKNVKEIILDPDKARNTLTIQCTFLWTILKQQKVQPPSDLKQDGTNIFLLIT